MAFDRLQKQHPGRFTRMLLGGSLYPYCQDIAQQAQAEQNIFEEILSLS